MVLARALPEDFVGEYETKSLVRERCTAMFAFAVVVVVGRNWKMGFSLAARVARAVTRNAATGFSAVRNVSFVFLYLNAYRVRLLARLRFGKTSQKGEGRRERRGEKFATDKETTLARVEAAVAAVAARPRRPEVTPLKLNFTDPLALTYRNYRKLNTHTGSHARTHTRFTRTP